MTNSFSIIIINWNTANLINKCLESIYNTTSPTKKEILIVDNNSSDNSQKTIIDLNKKYDFKYIFSGKNLGYGKACNLAASKTKNSLLLFLNTDIVLSPNYLKIIEKYFYILFVTIIRREIYLAI